MGTSGSHGGASAPTREVTRHLLFGTSPSRALTTPALQGGPGVGKTTLLREVAKLLSDTFK